MTNTMRTRKDRKGERQGLRAADNDALSARQMRFVEEFLVDFNATAAYKRAGYMARTRDAIWQGGHDLIQKPQVVVTDESKIP
jgi:hypothetical protein